MEACRKYFGTLSSLRVIQPDTHSFQVYHLIRDWYISKRYGFTVIFLIITEVLWYIGKLNESATGEVVLR